MADPSAETAPPKEFTAVPSDETRRIPEEVTSICLSGGGYRAMLFHTGALWRLHQTGLLPKIGIFSSVSGGSIANGWLALNWDALKAPGANFEQVFVAGMRQIANTTIDVWAVLGSREKSDRASLEALGWQIAQDLGAIPSRATVIYPSHYRRAILE